MKFLILFIVIPLVELYVMIAVGSEVGALPVVLWTVLSALLGVILIRQQGLATLQSAQVQMQSGTDLQESVFNGVFIFLGGVMVMLPGLITDALGLLILIPWVRTFILRKALQGMKMNSFRARSENRVYEGEFTNAVPKAPHVLEGEVIDRDKR